jgi:hypothetical protein
LAFIEQDATATKGLPYVKYFKHTYTIPSDITNKLVYFGTGYEGGTRTVKVDFVNKTYTGDYTPELGAPSFIIGSGDFDNEDTDISAYLTNGISGLPIPAKVGGVIRFVNADGAPVTSNITFVMSKA